MNGFKRRKVQSLTLGEKLKNIRGNKRASLADISKNTRIQIEYLEYLEQGAYDKLPADVYVRGFLRSFAEYLNVDEKDLIKSFKKEKSIQQNIEGDADKDKAPAKINLSNFSINPKITSIVLISVLFLGMSFYLYKKLDNFVSTPELIILNPEVDSIVFDSQVIVSGRTDEGNEVFINNQPVLVNENGAFKEDLILRNGINIIVVKSVNRFNKEAIKELSVEANYEIEISEENKESDPFDIEADKKEENNSDNINDVNSSAPNENAVVDENANNIEETVE
jgi:transcriptional regulator with XRE-family HTH domain